MYYPSKDFWSSYSGRGFKSHSGEISIATSKILQWWITYVSIYPGTNVITCARFCLKQMWRLTKTIAKTKCEHWTEIWNCSSCVSIHSPNNVITFARSRSKKMWRLTKEMAEMKCEHWTKGWNWSSCTVIYIYSNICLERKIIIVIFQRMDKF